MRIYVTGHNGMVGSAICRKMENEDVELIKTSSKELDLRNQKDTFDFIKMSNPDVIVDAAARVGGILANRDFPYEFLMENMMIQNNLIAAAKEFKVKKFVFLGSSCIYPKLAEQPIREDSLLTASLEETNQWYAVAKISGVKLVQALREEYGYDYFSLMPTNLYGPNDNFDLKTSHVLPAMIRKFHDAKIKDHAPVPLWGTGSPKREFLHVDDLASAVWFSLRSEMKQDLYNVGTGLDLSIKELAELVQESVGHKGEIMWDTTKPDGTPRKLLDVSRMANQGWSYSINLKEGIESTYSWFLANQDSFKKVRIA